MITALDKKTALVLIDLQNGIVQLPLAHPVNDVLANAPAKIQTQQAERRLRRIGLILRPKLKRSPAIFL